MPALAHLRPDHDETLIARLAADDLTSPEAASATALVATCPACAELHADLRSIISATATLPAPRRTRDFRLSEADAARLRPTPRRRLLGRFGEPRLAFTRPLATGLVALGIAGLVLSAAPSALPSLGGASTAAPAVAPVAGGALDTTGGVPAASIAATLPGSYGVVTGDSSGSGPNAEPSAAASAASIPNPPEPAASSPEFGSGGIASTPSSLPLIGANPGVGKSTDAGAVVSSPASPLLLVSLALVVLGLALFALRWIARRTA